MCDIGELITDTKELLDQCSDLELIYLIRSLLLEDA